MVRWKFLEGQLGLVEPSVRRVGAGRTSQKDSGVSWVDLAERRKMR